MPEKSIKEQTKRETLDHVLAMNIEDFFCYVKSIRYGYKDQVGNLHFSSDEDFTIHEYSFSSPEEVVKNNCCWCWDLAELIRLYCAEQGILHKSYFMEYLSDELHQTHTQVFLYYQGGWIAAPDNCLELEFGAPAFDDEDTCVNWFVSMFTDYLQSVLKEKYDVGKLVVKEYSCTFPTDISDDEYLSQIRQ